MNLLPGKCAAVNERKVQMPSCAGTNRTVLKGKKLPRVRNAISQKNCPRLRLLLNRDRTDTLVNTHPLP
ncbi:hypothetical protein pipiens_016017 [Culex pipiens pipiens]|uniref:Uncharacterized protein n=1 Tax=Culex pipiens pipiens TaxID=38569 RepID=A0ABD1CN04_CULPP